MEKCKKILLSLAPFSVFAVYFILSLSCATSSNAKVFGTGEEVSAYPITTENFIRNYDITLVSTENCPSRILKVIMNDENPTTYYTVSKPGDTEVTIRVGSGESATQKKVDYDRITDSELSDKFFLNEKDAQDAVAFINQLEEQFKENRYEEGILNKFQVYKKTIKTEKVWVVDDKSVGEYSTTETGHYETVETPVYTRILFIQHSTVAGEDAILYSANGSDIVKVTLEEILSVRDALSK